MNIDRSIIARRSWRGEEQPLQDHLDNVAEMTEKFFAPANHPGVGSMAGRLHDLAKVTDKNQRHLRGETVTGHRDHSTLGLCAATLARSEGGDHTVMPVGIATTVHHTGLQDQSHLKNRARRYRESAAFQELEDKGITDVAAEILAEPITSIDPDLMDDGGLYPDMFIRMLTSCLIDADRLDAEIFHFGPRDDLWVPFESLLPEAENYISDLMERAAREHPGELTDLRREVNEACQEAALGPPGFYRLHGSTGIGKTLSTLILALLHAWKWQKRKVITAVPYLSIIDQNSEAVREVFREAFGDNALLEHHSTIDWHVPERDDDVALAMELAAENWDAPIVMTTLVNLLETLFSARPDRLRRLHSMSDSVIILDEIQSLRPQLLEPTFAKLNLLVEHFGATVILSTATHPAYEKFMPEGVELNEVITSERAVQISNQLKRVKYVGADDPPIMTPKEVAEEMMDHNQFLTICNTKIQARETHQHLSGSDCRHLSSMMCPSHRKQVIAEVRETLRNGAPIRLVSTQVIEAGVNIDFPHGRRAYTTIPRFGQSGGRINRNGEIEGGGVLKIYIPVDEYEGAHIETKETKWTRAMFKMDPDLDPEDPRVHRKYFCGVYSQENGLDRVNVVDEMGKKKSATIEALTKRMMFKTISDAYSVIPDDDVSVVVRWEDSQEHIERLRQHVNASRRIVRRDVRRLQQFCVSISRRSFERFQQEGLVSEIGHGLWVWEGEYDETYGLIPPGK